MTHLLLRIQTLFCFVFEACWVLVCLIFPEHLESIDDGLNLFRLVANHRARVVISVSWIKHSIVKLDEETHYVVPHSRACNGAQLCILFVQLLAV